MMLRLVPTLADDILWQSPPEMLGQLCPLLLLDSRAIAAAAAGIYHLVFHASCCRL